jgi:hypothetical protein
MRHRAGARWSARRHVGLGTCSHGSNQASLIAELNPGETSIARYADSTYRLAAPPYGKPRDIAPFIRLSASAGQIARAVCPVDDVSIRDEVIQGWMDRGIDVVRIIGPSSA